MNRHGPVKAHFVIILSKGEMALCPSRKRDWAAKDATCRLSTIPARVVEGFRVSHPAIRCLAKSCKHQNIYLVVKVPIKRDLA